MMQVLHQQRFERPEPMRHRNPHAQLSPRLEQVTMRALEKEARRRFRTAGEMGEALGYRHSVDIAPMSARPGRAWLTILKGPRQGQRIPLAGRSVALGRANLGSTQSSISPLHANILPRGDGYWLQAVSRNSTWVDQQRVYGEVPLRTGAIIAIGDTVLRLDTQQ
jgi:acyl transferase domain-containing protein